MKCSACGREAEKSCSCWAQALDESWTRCPECDRDHWRKKIGIAEDVAAMAIPSDSEEGGP
jgi:hypothetical protein